MRLGALAVDYLYEHALVAGVLSVLSRPERHLFLVSGHFRYIRFFGGRGGGRFAFLLHLPEFCGWVVAGSVDAVG